MGYLCLCVFLQETYEVSDLLLYRASVSSSDTFNITLPNHFEITSTVKKLASSSAYVYYIFDNFDAGSLRGNGSISVRRGQGTPFIDKNTTIIRVNQPTTLKYEYDNGSHTISANGQSATGTHSDTLGNFKNINTTQYTVTELKVKAL